MGKSFSYRKSQQRSIFTISNMLHEIEKKFGDDPYGSSSWIFSVWKNISMIPTTVSFSLQSIQTVSICFRCIKEVTNNQYYWVNINYMFNYRRLLSSNLKTTTHMGPIWVVPYLKKKSSFWAITSKIWAEKLVQMSFGENSTCFT